MARKNTTPPVRNEVVNDAGEIIGWWWPDGRMIQVRSRNGQTKAATASASGSNDVLAYVMLSEAWAR